MNPIKLLFLALSALLVCATPVYAQTTIKVAWDASSSVPTIPDGYVTAFGTSSGAYSNTQDVGNVLQAPVALPAPATNYYLTVFAYKNTTTGRLLSGPAIPEVVFKTAGAPPPVCVVTLSGPPQIGSGGATGILSVSVTDPGCAWTLMSSQLWLSVSPLSGTGNGSSNFTAAANTVTTSPRTATVTAQGGASWTVTQAAYVPPPQPPADPCASGIPQVTIPDNTYTKHFKLNSLGRINVDLGWTTEITDRRIVWAETQLGTQPPQRITNPDVLATLTQLTYRSTSKGTFPLVVRAGDDKGCVGFTGAVRQIVVN